MHSPLYFLFTFFGHAVAKGVLSFQEFDMQFGCLAFLWAQSRPQLVTAQAVSMFLNLQLRLSKWEQMVCMPNGTARPGIGPSSGFLQSSSSEQLQTGTLVIFQTLFLLVSCSWSWQIPPSRHPEHSACPALVIKGSHHCCPGGRTVRSNTSACCWCLHAEELRGDCASSHCAQDKPHH